MFVGCDCYRRSGQDFKTEHVFDVVRNTGRVAVTPLGKNLELIGDAPRQNLICACLNASLFADLAPGGCYQRFRVFLTAGNGLPEAWMFGAFQQQDFQVGCMDNDQY